MSPTVPPGVPQGETYAAQGQHLGMPTLSAMPYPVDTLHPEPPLSQLMYLGKFDFSKMTGK
jgi:hypothetical protein